MPLQPPTQPTLADLLAALTAAVKSGERDRAQALELEIQRQIAAEAAEHARIERETRALIAELDRTETVEEGLLLPDDGLIGLKGATRQDGLVYPVWFATNRLPDEGGFGGARNAHTTLGRALVHVPAAHRFGEIGSGFWRRLRRFELRDDRLRLQAVDPREADAFYRELAEEMQAVREDGGTPHALVYIHGYNQSFEEAAIRAAQLGVDLKVPGATAFFSWPSRGSVAAYPVDEASIEASEPAMVAFLTDFTARCGAEKVHLIAHSMGNRGLLRAMQRIAATAETRSRFRLGQVFLAAPDVDRDLFMDLARLYPDCADRATLYTSADDKAVHLSSELHGAPRAGYFLPYTLIDGVDTVAVPDFDVDLLGHGYFAAADALLHDIYDLMRHNQAPHERQRIEAAEHAGKRFWRLGR